LNPSDFDSGLFGYRTRDGPPLFIYLVFFVAKKPMLSACHRWRISLVLLWKRLGLYIVILSLYYSCSLLSDARVNRVFSPLDSWSRIRDKRKTRLAFLPPTEIIAYDPFLHNFNRIYKIPSIQELIEKAHLKNREVLFFVGHILEEEKTKEKRLSLTIDIFPRNIYSTILVST
jgi:hypothetical protein